MKFWDSSAIVPLLISEPLREQLLDVLAGDAVMVVWWGTPVECTSAVARREREGDLGVEDATGALTRLRALALSWQEVVPTDAVRTVAQRLLRVHPLRGADGLQLAAAVVAAERDPQTLEFLSLDARLNSAAQKEGFPLVALSD